MDITPTINDNIKLSISINKNSIKNIYDDNLLENSYVGPIKISLNNISSDFNNKYCYECFIDGQPYILNTDYNVMGSHYFTIIVYNLHNYQTSYFNYKFNIMNEYNDNNEVVGYVSKPFIDYSPKYTYTNKIEIKITYDLSTKDFNENKYIKSKKYKIDYDDGTTSGENFYNNSFYIEKNCTITAIKTLVNDLVITDTLNINFINSNNPLENIKDNVEILVDDSNNGIIFPTIKKSFGYNYNLYINGLPYYEGNPITNYYRGERNFRLRARITDNINHQYSIIEKELNINTLMPDKPQINIKDGSIIRVNKDFEVSIINKSQNCSYTVYLNDNKIEISPTSNKFKPFINEKELNKSYILTIICINIKNKQSSISTYFFDINNNLNTDSFYTLTEARNVIKPYSMENSYYNHSNELVINDRNGDIGFTTDTIDENQSYELRDLSYNMKNDLIEYKNQYEAVIKFFNIYISSILKLFEYFLDYMKDSNNNVIKTIKEYYDSLVKIKDKIEKEINKNDIDTTELSKSYLKFIEEFNNLKTIISTPSSEDENSFGYNITILKSLDTSGLKEKLFNDLLDVYNQCSNLAIMIYNKFNIDDEISDLFTTSEFNIYYNSIIAKINEIQTKITNFIE